MTQMIQTAQVAWMTQMTKINVYPDWHSLVFYQMTQITQMTQMTQMIQTAQVTWMTQMTKTAAYPDWHFLISYQMTQMT